MHMFSAVQLLGLFAVCTMWFQLFKKRQFPIAVQKFALAWQRWGVFLKDQSETSLVLNQYPPGFLEQ